MRSGPQSIASRVFVAAALLSLLLQGCGRHEELAPAQAGATGADWPSYGGTTYAWRYSKLDQIDASNVKRLRPAWIFQTGDYSNALQATPIVRDGVMYFSTARAEVFALDAATGAMRWHYKYPVKVGPGTPVSSRGVAVGDEFVYIGTWDSHLLAIDRRTGREAWNVALDVGNCFSCAINAAPLLANDLVVIGQGGGDAGYRGHLTALDARTGRFRWRFYATPAPGEPGHETWKGDSWKTGGGAPWSTGSYDPELNLIYWATGNPSPGLTAASRDPQTRDRRDTNLYTSSVVALDPASGQLRWHYQVVPNDVWDYDAVAECVLVDRVVGGKLRHLLVHASKSGIATVLDRTTGAFVRAFPFAELVTWLERIDDDGAIIGRREPVAGIKTNICPGPFGAKSWNQMAYSPRTGLIYLPIVEVCADYVAEGASASPEALTGEAALPGFGGSATDAMPPGQQPHGHVDAFAVDGGKRVWQYAPGTFTAASVLATAGDLVFSGDALGNFFALDARSGAKLWTFFTGAGHRGSAISYAVDDRQYIATPTGFAALIGGQLRNLVGDDVEFRNGSTLIVFALPDER